MTHGEMVRAVARRERLSILHCTEVLRAWSAVAAEELAAGRDVTIAGLGTLSPSARGARFRPAKAVRDARREATPEGEEGPATEAR